MNDLVFTNLGMLWGLIAATLPLIIHLINRSRARRRPFAAIDFLLRVQRRSARRILLRQILLLISRTLLIVALVIAAADPVLRPRWAAVGQGPTTTALVLDRSFSMLWRSDGRTLFELAKVRAAEAVRGMGPEDRMCLLTAGLADEVLVQPCTDSRATLLDAISRLSSAYGTSDLTRAMETAAGLLSKSPGPNRRVLLLSDGAAHAFPGPPRWPADMAPPEVVLDDLAPEHPRDNHAVAAVEQHQTGRLIEVAARLQSFSATGEQGLPVEVRLGSDPITRGFVDLPPGESARKVFNIPQPSGKGTIASVDLKPDALPQDDTALFFASGGATVNALLVDGDLQSVLQQDELFYAERALSPSGENASGITTDTVTPDRFREGLLQGVQVLFLANVRDLPPDAVTAIRHFVSAGGGLFYSVGDQVDVDRANTQLSDLLPWALRDIVSLGPADPDGTQRSGIPFTEPDLEHPIFTAFRGAEGQALAAVHTWRAAVLEPGKAASGTRVLLRYGNGAPALVDGPFGRGRVLLLTSSLDRDWNSWPARASFVPFLQRSCFYLAGRLGEVSPPEVVVGAPVRFPVIPEADTVRITRPDSTSVALGTPDIVAGQAIFKDTFMPGWYSVEQAAGGQALTSSSIPGFIVRPPLSESNLKAVAPEALQELVGKGTLLSVASAAGPLHHSQAMTFLLLALLLVLCEAVLVRK